MEDVPWFDIPVSDLVLTIDRMNVDIDVWQGVAMDSLKFQLGSPCPTLMRPAGGPAGCLLPLWTPHAVHLWTRPF
jgi:hypothetical protein